MSKRDQALMEAAVASELTSVSSSVTEGGRLLFMRALGHRSFALLWSGQTVSRLGDNLYRIALIWWVIRQTGSAVAMGTLLICSLLPTVLFLLIGGVTVDRIPRLRVMVAADLGRALLVSGITILSATGMLQFWHLCLASLMFGFISAFFQPAYAAAVPDIVPGELLPSANALTSLSAQIGSISGPVLAAALIAASGPSITFGLDAISFTVAAVCLLPLLRGSGRRSPASGPGKQNILSDLGSGLRTVWAIPWLRLSLLIAALGNITMVAPYEVSLPFLIRSTLHAGVSALGFVLAIHTMGAILTAVWLGRSSRFSRRGILAYLALLGAGATIFTHAMPIGIAGIALVGALLGGALTVFSQVWTITLQEFVPREMLGRVNSVDMLGSLVLLPFGYWLIGTLTDGLSAPVVFAAGGVLTIALAALGLSQPAIRRLD